MPHVVTATPTGPGLGPGVLVQGRARGVCTQTGPEGGAQAGQVAGTQGQDSQVQAGGAAAAGE